MTTSGRKALLGEEEPVDRCWARIGVWGDRACPELRGCDHCHHCPVFADAARRFLERPVPAGYGQDQLAHVAEASVEAERTSLSVTVFRVASELLCVETKYVSEALEPRSVHRVTRRSNEVFAGLVNVHGQLELCGSLYGLLRLGAEPKECPLGARMLVLTAASSRWVVCVDAVTAVKRYPLSQLVDVPSAFSGAAGLARKLLRSDTERVGYLRGDELVAEFDRSLS